MSLWPFMLLKSHAEWQKTWQQRFDEQNKALDSERGTSRILKDAIAQIADAAKMAAAENANLKEQLQLAGNAIRELQEKLKKAEKNDGRDKKSGRFTGPKKKAC